MANCANCNHDENDHDTESSDLWIGRCEYRHGAFQCDCEGFIEPNEEMEEIS